MSQRTRMFCCFALFVSVVGLQRARSDEASRDIASQGRRCSLLQVYCHPSFRRLPSALFAITARQAVSLAQQRRCVCSSLVSEVTKLSLFACWSQGITIRIPETSSSCAREQIVMTNFLENLSCTQVQDFCLPERSCRAQFETNSFFS